MDFITNFFFLFHIRTSKYNGDHSNLIVKVIKVMTGQWVIDIFPCTGFFIIFINNRIVNDVCLVDS